VVLGALLFKRVDDHQAKTLIGWIVIALLVLHLMRRRQKQTDEAGHGWWFAPLIGVLAGFTTLVANAAGPRMAIYLLAMRLPKMEFVGTGAVFFMLLNLYKVPFMIYLGQITSGSFSINLLLAPAVFVGAFLGRKLLPKIDQKLFENLALALAAAAALKLLF
jgi:uncharacterized membrane protein YfcA